MRSTVFALLCSLLLVAPSAVGNAKPDFDPASVEYAHPTLPPSKEDTYCLAKVIYFEARDQNDAGKLGVALVTLNRVRDWGKYDSVCDAVYDGCNYTWVCTFQGSRKRPFDMRHIYEKTEWVYSLSLAYSTMLRYNAGMDDITHGATFYHEAHATPYWANTKNIRYTVRLDGHIFYRKA